MMIPFLRNIKNDYSQIYGPGEAEETPENDCDTLEWLDESLDLKVSMPENLEKVCLEPCRRK